jgi:hypothetical protein
MFSKAQFSNDKQMKVIAELSVNYYYSIIFFFFFFFSFFHSIMVLKALRRPKAEGGRSDT